MLKKISLALTLVLFGLIPFNAFLTTYINFGLAINFPVNAWKEVLIVILTLLTAWDLFQRKRLPTLQKLDWVILAFFVLAILSAVLQTRELGRIIFGFKYDLEFLWLFLLLRHSSWGNDAVLQKVLRVVLVSASIVLLFGLLQISILPKDFLVHFGYSPEVSTWVPGGPLPIYHAADQFEQVLRAASTLSGPNQFAAYLLVILFLSLAFLWHHRKQKKWLLLSIVALIDLIFTYSRSAYLAAFVTALTGLFLIVQNRKRVVQIGAAAIILAVVGVGTFFITHTQTFEQLVLRASSSQGHFERSRDGIIYTLQNPLGHGIGNAGPASTRFNADQIGWIPESWYLQVSLELGIVGLVLFLSILVLTLRQLWQKYREEKTPVPLGLFLGLLALCITSLVLHSWEESAVALTFWGLAGLTLHQTKGLKESVG